MHIENQEALKTWLTAYLGPLCDADPMALSKYVIALIKKDKPLSDLKVSMEAQMEVFLQKDTKTFVDDIFEALESQSYVDGVPPIRKKSDPIGGAEGAKQPADSTTPVRSPEDQPHGHAEEPSHVRERSRDRYGRKMGRRELSPFRPRRTSPVRPGRFGRRRRSRSPRSRSRSPGYHRSRRDRSPYGRGGRSRSHSPVAYKRRGDSSGTTPTKDEESNPYLPAAKRPRCRDYDEKGYCLQGDQCKFDHGNDAVVLEDSAGGPGATPYTPVAVTAAANYAEPYVPAGVPLPPLNVPPPGYPNMAVSNPRKRGLEANSYPPAKLSAFHRLGGRGRGRGRGAFRGGRGGGPSRQLAVRNIPPELNSIAHLNNHFTRFGSLVNVQVHFEDDPSSALVTFASPTEAEAAHSSAEAVLGNRFIKMFFHHDRTGRRDHNEEMVQFEGNSLTKTIPNKKPKTEEELAAEEQQKADEKAAALAAIKKNQELLETKAQVKKEAEEKRKDQIKKKNEILKSKQELLAKLMEEQKKIITKIEEKKNTMKPEEKSALMSLLKSVSSSVDKARQEVKSAMAQVTVKKSPVDVQKELLDAELELFQAQQDGSESQDEIQKRVNLLRIEAAKAGILPTSRPPRGRGMGFRRPQRGFYSPRFRGRGRGGGMASFQGTTLDRRPSKIVVSGHEPDEKESLLEHFQQFGEVIDSVDDESSNSSMTIQFKSRREAEAAMNSGKNFNDKTLALAWDTSANSSAILDSTHGSDTLAEAEETEDDYTPLDPTYLPPGLHEEDDEAVAATNEEVNELLYSEEGNAEPDVEEEEEEEDDESRSWKR